MTSWPIGIGTTMLLPIVLPRLLIPRGRVPSLNAVEAEFDVVVHRFHVHDGDHCLSVERLKLVRDRVTRRPPIAAQKQRRASRAAHQIEIYRALGEADAAVDVVDVDAETAFDVAAGACKKRQ